MISHFFIDRPIFAMVLSIVITIGGAVALFTLPIAQYPEITPPTVQVTAVYPGASARVVADTVAAPIEQQVNGVENMLYMSSQCTNDGAYTLTVTFKLGTNLDMATVLVQNRVNRALPQMPDTVQQQGVTVVKKSPSILLAINLFSTDGSFDQLYMSNFATTQLKDELARLDGVGDVTFLGQQDYSMRAWLDPDALAYHQLTASDVVNAIRQQNVQVAAGQIGQEPVPKGQAYQLTVSTLGRLTEVEEFENIVVKVAGTSSDGTARPAVLLKDVVRRSVPNPDGSETRGVELTAKSQDIRCTLDGRPSVAMAVFQLPGSNALETADRVKAKMEQLRVNFPAGMEYAIVYDTTPFISESIDEVVHAFRDAVVLVAIVVLVFLQSWRSTIIPLVAVPVSIVGTFLVMKLLGFSLNNISLFGLILAIGIVVDDAIVVVENVERWLAQGMSPRDAARRAMDEVTGPVIAVSLVLCAVFVPCAFITGISGQFFQQFAVTIAVSTVISAVNSLTLSPALAALLLRPHGAKKDFVGRALDTLLGWFFRAFNKGFDRASNFYAKLVRGLLRVSVLVMLVYVGLLFLTYKGFTTTPTGFIPLQDKGYLLVSVQLPDSASVQRTDEVMAEVDKIARETPGVEHTMAVSGQSILLSANGSNFGSMFVVFKPFHDRHSAETSLRGIYQRIQSECSRKVQGGVVAAFPPPPVDGLGNAGGFKVMIEDRADQGLLSLQEQTDNFVAKSREVPGLSNLFTQFRATVPQLYIDVDRRKCLQMGVPVGDVFNTLQVYLGGLYVNDFNRFGRTWQVNVQADAPFRASASYVRNLKVRNDRGEMVPLGSLATIEDVMGPVMVTRYNMYPAAAVNGGLAPGVSTGQGVELVQKLAAEQLPRGMTFEWTEIFFMQLIAGDTTTLVFGGAVLLVFLVLAAQYESWGMPLAVILVVPMCLLCSIAGVRLAGLDINIFTQIGFVVLVGLASKNAILIVEFARQQRAEGVPLVEATVEACRLRLRPILMTSFAFILGVVPLVLASGAGYEMRATLGIAVFSGMLGVTVFGLFLTPVFFYLIGKLTPDRPKAAPAPEETTLHPERPKTHS